MIELADIFRDYGPSFRESHKLPLACLKVINAIEKCRSAALGGHIDQCDACGNIRISYNSCRDRHCPKCQNIARANWLTDRKSELIPVTYYHIVFTIPDKLNEIILKNKTSLYNILFKAASKTLIKLGLDKKHLGAQTGLIAVLHTWGQNLSFHPHLHCIVPGGGLSTDHKKWVYPKKSKKNKKFFIHVNIISDLFKNIFLSYLNEDYKKGKITGHNNQKMINDLYQCKWVTYCKRPFGNSGQVIDYLGRYTHRVAITNNRIIKMENDKVSFSWRDYKDSGKVKVMELDAFEFIRRFLLHVLPSGFFKIRYYGFLASRNKKKNINLCRKGLCSSTEEITFKFKKVNLFLCPKCQKGNMILKETIRPELLVPI